MHLNEFHLQDTDVLPDGLKEVCCKAPFHRLVFWAI